MSYSRDIFYRFKKTEGGGLTFQEIRPQEV